MATKLFLRNTTNNGIDSTKADMVTTAGSASTTNVVNTAASGTEIQWTVTAGGALIEWISGRVPAGGFTLSGTMTFSIWAHESHMNANCGARARVFKRTAAGVVTEIGGGPFNDGVEFGTAATEMVWTGTPTSTAFAEDDRILVRFYITNIGTMASGHTCTITFDAPDATTGDSFFQITENVTFKGEAQTLTPSLFTNSQTFHGPTVSSTYSATASLFTNTQSFFGPTVSEVQSISPSLFTNSQTFYAATISTSKTLTPNLFTNSQTFFAPTVGTTYALSASLFANSQTFFGPTVAASNTLTPGLFTNSQTFFGPTIGASGALAPSLFTNTNTFYSPTITAGAAGTTLSPSLFENTQVFYSPSVLGPQTLAATLFTNEQTFYGAILEQGRAVISSISLRGGISRSDPVNAYKASKYIKQGRGYYRG